MWVTDTLYLLGILFLLVLPEVTDFMYAAGLATAVLAIALGLSLAVRPGYTWIERFLSLITQKEKSDGA
jgi:hypothetical protein